MVFFKDRKLVKLIERLITFVEEEKIANKLLMKLRGITEDKPEKETYKALVLRLLQFHNFQSNLTVFVVETPHVLGIRWQTEGVVEVTIELRCDGKQIARVDVESEKVEEGYAKLFKFIADYGVKGLIHMRRQQGNYGRMEAYNIDRVETERFNFHMQMESQHITPRGNPNY